MVERYGEEREDLTGNKVLGLTKVERGKNKIKEKPDRKEQQDHISNLYIQKGCWCFVLLPFSYYFLGKIHFITDNQKKKKKNLLSLNWKESRKRIIQLNQLVWGKGLVELTFSWQQNIFKSCQTPFKDKKTKWKNQN